MMNQEPHRHEIVVLDKTFRIEPTALYAYQIPVDLNKRPGCHIAGTVSASGGTHNDIEVLLFSQGDYKNWEYQLRRAFDGNPRAVAGLYRSGRVTDVTFDVPLPGSDTYYLVFNNHFSTFVWKDIKALVYLRRE